METNLSFCGSTHLSPVTNRQIDEFVDLLRRSVVLQQLYNGRKNVKKIIKMIALRLKKEKIQNDICGPGTPAPVQPVG